MNLALLYGKPQYSDCVPLRDMLDALRRAGHRLTLVHSGSCLSEGFDMLLSVGGDGTFLCACSMAARCGVPILGVNLGRMGFLSENSPRDVADALLSGRFRVEERAVLEADDGQKQYFALNEITASRNGSAMLGVKVSIDSVELPTYWGDGLLVATASGSTAYSLSVGGPIVLPSSKVIIVSPIAPHNLNVRPMIIPQESHVQMQFIAREDLVKFSADNDSHLLSTRSKISVKVAQFSLKRVCLENSNFIKALSDKFHWGEDVRNEKYD